MSSREKFEAWMASEQWFHDSDFKWDEIRNCYAEYGIHIAFKAYQAGAASMQAERDQLAAENACLKQSIEEVAEAFETGTDGVLATAVDESLNILTPETDAVLKRIQAQGVEMLTAKLQSLIDEGNFEGDEIGVIAGAVYTGADIAAQLRNEVNND